MANGQWTMEMRVVFSSCRVDLPIAIVDWRPEMWNKTTGGSNGQWRMDNEQ
jgi:hypothetical protein